MVVPHDVLGFYPRDDKIVKHFDGTLIFTIDGYMGFVLFNFFLVLNNLSIQRASQVVYV
jgi:hypothetical protein